MSVEVNGVWERRKRGHMNGDTMLILQKLEEMKADITEVKTDVSELKTDVAGLKTDMTGVKKELAEVKEDLVSTKEDLGQKIQSLKLTLENETNHNIQIIAENHLDLNRKLNEALKIEMEKEIFMIRFNHLENEVRKIKEHIQIA